MPRQSLSSFYEFAHHLLPHQIDYIYSTHQISDPEKKSILDALYQARDNMKQLKLQGQLIDKRKYSYIKSYIEKRLSAIDVDRFYNWLSNLDRKIMTDDLSLDDEQVIMGQLRSQSPQAYYFLRFYEVMQNYSNFLLIRVRRKNLEEVNNYLQQFQAMYTKSMSVFKLLQNATFEIVENYKHFHQDSQKWEQTLIDIFEDESIDGQNRYFAIVRLTFLYYLSKEYDRLESLYKKLDGYFSLGQFYSPRILVNYYANLLLVHARENELDKAAHYGFLSIAYKTNDYLQYLNNMAAVLMRQGRHKEALGLLSGAITDFRSTLSSHNRIGFASFYVMALIRNKRANDAVMYASDFLSLHREDILQNRWHIFFTSYAYALLETENYPKIISLEKKYNLLGMETDYRRKAGYIPSFIWIYQLARYKELQITQAQLLETLYDTSVSLVPDPHKFRLMKEMCLELMPHEPQSFKSLLGRIFHSGDYKVTPRFFV